jgi:hypothetical protein
MWVSPTPALQAAVIIADNAGRQVAADRAGE